MRRLMQRLLHPFPPFPLIAGQYVSALEAQACAGGAAQVERTFALRPVGDIAVAFARFMVDPEAIRALKKAYHATYEQRARALAARLEPAARNGFDPVVVPPEDHPLDWFIASDLAALDARAVQLPLPKGDRARQLCAILAWAAVLAAAPIWIAVRHGRPLVTPRRIEVLACESVHDRNWQQIVTAAKDAGLWRDGAMAILRLSRQGRTSAVLPVVDGANAAVPHRLWWREVAIPALRLARTVLGLAWRHSDDARVVEAATRCLNLAASSLAVLRVGYAFDFRLWIDDAEHDPLHIVKSIIARRRRGATVRMPRTEQDSPGTMMSFMGYDTYPAGGPYQAATYRETWYPGCRAVPIGLLQLDHRVRRAQLVAPEIEQAIESRLNTGKKMAVFFGPSDVPGLNRPMTTLFDLMVAELGGRDDWFLVLKPKLDDVFRNRLAADSRYAGWRAAIDLVEIRYDTVGIEICPSSWLIERMALGTGWQGTIATETVTQGKPFFCWYPFIEPTPYKHRLAALGFLNDTYDGYRLMVRNYLDDPDPSRFDFDWFRRSFDPFSDQNAFGRLAGLLFGQEHESVEPQRAIALQRM